MHKYVIESSVFAQQGDYFVHGYTITSKRTKVNAVMSAKSTNNAYTAAIVKSPFVYTGPPIQVASYNVRQSSPDRIEVLPVAVVAVDLDRHPVTTRVVRRIQIVHEQSVRTRL